MKAYKITSTEYRANQASVFVFVNGEYFGDLAYVRRENYPQDINHWMEATCADSDRYFIVKEVEISEEQINDCKNIVYRTVSDFDVKDDTPELRHRLRKALKNYIYKKTKNTPMIVPVITKL